ncbi:hypothetical protein PG999_009162 [Apiospora kogelbergensis]|uniref:Uncharacterized protein n=1 Tax=Apiospora kogelbergensis TaxID=1337665 RepID=A0AAW0QT09_9PEZI
MAVDFVFSPLSFIGLLRVFCALWLTDDFNYTSKHTIAHMTESFHLDAGVESMRRNSVDSLLDPSDGRPLSGHRLFYLLLLLFMLAMGIMFLIDFGAFIKQYTATSFSVVLFYVVFLAATSVICAFYFATDSTSTVIPCITTTWYKVYSAATMAFALVTFVISCVETQETFCGKFTSAPGWAGDYEACSTSEQFIVPLSRDNSSAFGITTMAVPRILNEEPLQSGEFLVWAPVLQPTMITT